MAEVKSQQRQFIEELQAKSEEEKKKRLAMQKHLSSTNFEREDESNVLKWLLDIEEDMQTIEHLLKGDVPRRDGEGNEFWEECPQEEKLFSDRGVRELLKIIRGYLTKNLFLSNFSEEDIRIRCMQFAQRLNDFIHNSYELLGWDTIDKMKHYQMVVGWLVDMVESAYYRSLNGFTLKQIGTKTSIIQNIDEGQKQMYPSVNNEKKGILRKLFG